MTNEQRAVRAVIVAAICSGFLVGCDGSLILEGERLRIPLEKAEQRAPAEKLPPGLEQAEPDTVVRVLVDLAAQVDLTALGAALAERRAAKSERRRLATTALEQVAAETQKQLRPFLDEQARRGEIRRYHGFSIVNRLLVEGTVGAVRELARRPEVASVVAETESTTTVWSSAKVDEEPAPRRLSWSIEAVRAEMAWEQGLDGQGVVVGIIDSGASAAHEQLGGGFVGAGRGWLDPKQGSAEPRDGALGHGTGVLSAAVGQNLRDILLGIAPAARWAACAALPDGHFHNVRITECADWMLNTAQPDVLINSWLLPDPGCDRSVQRIVDAWRVAEILPVFAAGNDGPEPGRDHSPANYTGLYPGSSVALSVGGLSSPGQLYERSTAGPNSCDAAAVYPVLAAPAWDLVTALPLAADTYRQAEGTSYAAGVVAGAAALLLQHRPAAGVLEVEAALLAGAVDLGPEGPDPRFGYGRLDLPRSLAALDRILTTSGASKSANDPAAHE